MRKFLAVLFASVMVLAIASPAYATATIDYIYINIAAPEVDEEISSANESITINSVVAFGGGEVAGAASIDYDLTKWQVKSGGQWEDYSEATFESGNEYRAKIAVNRLGDNNFQYSICKIYYGSDPNPVTSATEAGSGNMVYVYSNSFTLASKYTVTCTNNGHGSCSISGTNKFAAGETYAVNTEPNPGYELAELIVKRQNEESKYVYENTNTFTMPADNVTVLANFILSANRISRVDVTVNAVLGENVLDTAPVVGTEYVTADFYTWYKLAPGGDPENDMDDVLSTDVFEEGYTYYLDVTLSPDDDHRFITEETTLYINGVQSESGAKSGREHGDSVSITPVSGSADTPITEINVTIIPVLGNKVLATDILIDDADMADAIKIEEATWNKYPIGTDADITQVEVTDPDEVFQEGYKYIYHAKITALEGFKLQDGAIIYVNGDDEGVANSDVMWVEAYLECVEQPKITEGKDQQVDLGGNAVTATFRSSAEFSTFVEVRVDGNKLDSTSYTAAEGSTVVTLKKAYLNTLANGVHTITIVSTTGSASADFTIVGGTSTAAGDTFNVMGYVIALVAAVMCAGAVLFVRKRVR